MINVEQFIEGYIVCALWTEEEQLQGATMAPETLQALKDQCLAFIHDPTVSPLLELASDHRASDHLGHDFWLTRNGHGSGYWDREELDIDDLGSRLSNLVGYSTNYPPVDLYVADDGMIYA